MAGVIWYGISVDFVRWLIKGNYKWIDSKNLNIAIINKRNTLLEMESDVLFQSY